MTMYKLSKYTHFLSPSNSAGHYVYNAISNGLATLDNRIYELLQPSGDGIGILEGEGTAESAALLNQLRSGHIIVENDFDEIDFLRIKMNLARYSTRGLILTIVPTLGCNLACTYCYEGLTTVRFMSPEVQDSVVRFAKSQLERGGYRSLSVAWYGGEPLLKPELLYMLSRRLLELCEQLNVTYSATIVTNGTLLTPEVAHNLKALNISEVQVTLDGPKEVHDARRPYKGTTASSFDVITGNIDRVVDILEVKIRINVDRSNCQRSMDLVSQIKARGWLDNGRRCGIYLGFTREWTPVCSSIGKDCFTSEQFFETELQFQHALMNDGFELSSLYPLRPTYCPAVSPHCFVVDPEGLLYKCWLDVNDAKASVGSTLRPLEANPNLLKWLAYEPLYQFIKCRDCGVFPICGGGCPSLAIRSKNQHGDNSNCTPWKYLMTQKIDVFLEQLSRKAPDDPEMNAKESL